MIREPSQDRFLKVMKATIFTVLLVLIAYIGETGRDGGFIKDIWSAAKTASPFAAMFAVLAWLSERQDRRAAQVELLERTVGFVEATNEQSGSIERMVEAIKQISAVISKGNGFESPKPAEGKRPRRRKK